jgi:ABC-2 type transport system ATP-binding protein
MNIIKIENVTKTFDDFTAVDDLSLSVPKGSIYGFIGPNGSGKTTTLRMIMRILHPDVGKIRVLDEESYGAAHDRIGYLPEERGLYKKMKVCDILRFYAELKSVRDCKAAVADWLARLDLSGWANKKVETLSKGMSQKIQFIAAVIAEPELVILDEPFAGLDPVNLDVLRESVLDLRRRGSTVLFSTHDMGIAENLCDFVFMIFEGKKVLDGTMDAVQGDYGQDTLRVKMDASDGDLAELPGIAHVTDFGQFKELRINPGADTQEVLRALMQRGRVAHFELARPSLHDIFVRIARPGTAETDSNPTA